jgi:hypothetical protein
MLHAHGLPEKTQTGKEEYITKMMPKIKGIL